MRGDPPVGDKLSCGQVGGDEVESDKPVGCVPAIDEVKSLLRLEIGVGCERSRWITT